LLSPCGHSLCAQCANVIKNGPRKAICCECRQPIMTLILNVTVLRIIEEQNTASKKVSINQKKKLWLLPFVLENNYLSRLFSRIISDSSK